MFLYMLLTLLKKIDSNRSPAAVYYILIGKKSSQITQDLHTFNLQPYFKLLPSLRREDFNKSIHELEKQGLLIHLSDKDYKLTEKAERLLQSNSQSKELLASLEKHVVYEDKWTFIQRFYLIIQTFTHHVMDKKDYFPVVEDVTVQAFVKQYYKKNKHDLTKWLEECYHVLHDVLRSFKDQDCHIYLDRLATYKQNGQSLQQLTDHYDVSHADVLVICALIEHKLFHYCQEETTVLKELFRGKAHALNQRGFMTLSAQKSYQLLQRGYSLDELVTIRQLKRGTIEDHLVEIFTMDDRFSVEDYVSAEHMSVIQSVIDQNSTKKLSDIKKLLPNDITYLELRLVFIRYKKKVSHERT